MDVVQQVNQSKTVEQNVKNKTKQNVTKGNSSSHKYNTKQTNKQKQHRIFQLQLYMSLSGSWMWLWDWFLHREGPPRLITLPAPPKRREMVSSTMHLDPVGSSQSRYVETEPTVEEKDEGKDKDKNCDDQSRLRPRNGIKPGCQKEKEKRKRLIKVMGSSC